MENNIYISGSELRQFLHISTRKMKFIMDNNLIPHENTGQVTHKYRVKRKDAAKFKSKMKSDPNFMIEFKGQFTSRPDKQKEKVKREKENTEFTLSNEKKFVSYIKMLWQDLPDAIPAQEVAKIIGVNPKSLHRLKREGKLNSVNIAHVQYCAKSEIIYYLASETQIRFNRTEEYLAIYNGFLKENGRKI